MDFFVFFKKIAWI